MGVGRGQGMSEPHDVPSYREFADLDKRHTALEATVTNQLSRMSTDITEVKMLLMRPPPPAPQPQETAAALALHRALDAAEKLKGNGAHPFLFFLSGLGLLALGAGVAWVVLH